VPPGFAPQTAPRPKPTQQPRKPQPAKPDAEPAKPETEAGEPQAEFVGPQPEPSEPPTEAAKPQAEPGAPEPGEAEPATPQPPPPPLPTPTGALNLQNASLTEVIDALCRQLRINYILDPRVQGGIILNTYGEIRDIDTRSLLDMILRINGAAMVQVGEIHRIVPLAEASRLPIPPQVNAKDIPEDDRVMLNLVFLKYAMVQELSTLLEPFIGEGASTWAYAPANLLLVLDSGRNMRRTMELVALFDSDILARQRVRLFDVEHGRPSDIASELETVLQAIALGEGGSPIKFLPINRLNLIVAVAPNPGAFEEVEKWIKKFDQPVKVTAGTVDNYVYRVMYGRAENLAGAIMSLYMGMRFGGMGYGLGAMSGLFSGAASGFGNRYRGSGRMGGGYGGYGGMGGGYGGMGGGYGGMGGGYGGYGGMGGGYGGYAGPSSGALTGPGASGEQAAGESDLTGSYMGAGGYGGYGGGMRIPHVVPNPMANTLLIQATPQEYKQILKLLHEMDVPPRQVLIDAKIYEVTLTGAFSSGVSAYLQKAGQGQTSASGHLAVGSVSSAGVDFSIGTLVGASRELLVFLQSTENTTRAKVLSAPSIIATDNIPASITIGSEVPTLTAQAVSPIQVGGSSMFTNSIANRDSGVTLSILAQINPSGIVTLVIDQEVSSPVPPPAGGIQSPSFSKRTIQTQVTLRDGDTIAIGGIINETEASSSAGVPYLHRIPVLGHLFGAKSRSVERNELVVFMTPRVIYDTNQITDATEELKSRFRKLSRLLKNQ
jgi:general secretion pathway protein D